MRILQCALFVTIAISTLGCELLEKMLEEEATHHDQAALSESGSSDQTFQRESPHRKAPVVIEQLHLDVPATICASPNRRQRAQVRVRVGGRPIRNAQVRITTEHQILALSPSGSRSEARSIRVDTNSQGIAGFSLRTHRSGWYRIGIRARHRGFREVEKVVRVFVD